ncbi:MAG TPA: glycosyltransferase family A protein [Coleofasciculaceae cyanobacterium]
MKVAIQNPFAGQFVAETELSRRICLAANRLGWETAEVQTSAEIKACQPDFVIALHNNSPKLAEYPTYGCMWNPPSFFEGTEKYVKHVLSYDGYLTSSPAIDRWLHHLLYPTPKVFLTAPFYTSCPQNQYQPPDLATPRLVYLGSNWDGLRFQELFEQLDHQDYLQVYGNPDGWRYLHHAYQCALPYDGESVLRALNQAGVGLCLHRQEHRQAALPSMRIFEIVASGAIAICGEHPFIRAAFGDSVLYLDPDAPWSEQVKQISSHMQWIKAHPTQAMQLSAQAHQIFLQHYALEKLLAHLLVQHQAFIQPDSDQPHKSSVQIILRSPYQDPDALANALHHIAQQTYRPCKAIVVQSAASAAIPLPASALPIKSVQAASTFASSSLWAGLQAIDADYFAILNPADYLYPNHLQTLVALLDQHPEVGAVYSGGLQPLPEALICFQPFHLDQLLTLQLPIPLSGILIRRSLLDAILLEDPQLDEFADLCLLLHLAQRTPLLFSYAVTYETGEPIDRSLWQTSQDWSSELSRLKFIFWHQEFAPGKTLQSVQQTYREQVQLRSKVERLQSQLSQTADLQAELQATQARLEAMKTSKFWQLRSVWFKAKRAIGLSTADE